MVGMRSRVSLDSNKDRIGFENMSVVLSILVSICAIIAWVWFRDTE